MTEYLPPICQTCNTIIIDDTGSGGLVAGGSAVVWDSVVRGGVVCSGSAYVSLPFDVWDGAVFCYPLDGEYIGENYEVDDVAGDLDGTGGDGNLEDCPTLDNGIFCLGSQNFTEEQFIDLLPDDLSGSAFSLSAWVNLSGYFLERTWYSRGFTAVAGDEWSIRFGHSVVNHVWLSIQVTGSDGTEQHDCYSSVLLSSDKWYHVACSYDGSTMRVFINGAQVGNTIVGLPLVGLINNSFIGRFENGQGYEGNIQELRMYPEAKPEAWFQMEHDNFCSSGWFLVGEAQTVNPGYTFEEEASGGVLAGSSSDVVKLYVEEGNGGVVIGGELPAEGEGSLYSSLSWDDYESLTWTEYEALDWE